MERTERKSLWRRVRAGARRLLFPGWRAALPLMLLAVAAQVWTFTRNLEQTPFGYGTFALSAYALTAALGAAVNGVRTARRQLRKRPLVGRYLKDAGFRVRMGLTLSLLVNLCYAGFRLACAVFYRSFWDGALAAYYVCLCAVRAYLLRRLPDAGGRAGIQKEWRVYRTAGAGLLALSVALNGIAVQIVRDGQRYDYPGTLIYAAAAYSFYCMGLAVYNKVKFRRFNSPVLSAAKAVNLTCALTSVFSLETAMMAQFGDGSGFEKYMTGGTAVLVCIAALAQAVFMLLRANRRLRAVDAEHTETERGTGI